MKGIRRKFIITAAVFTALAAAVTYLVSRTWQSAAIAAGIVILIFFIIAKAVGSLISKGVGIAVDKAGNLLLKLLSGHPEQDNASDGGKGEEETPDGDESGKAPDETARDE